MSEHWADERTLARWLRGYQPTTDCLDGYHKRCRGGFHRSRSVPCTCQCHLGWQGAEGWLKARVVRPSRQTSTPVNDIGAVNVV